MKVAPIRSRRKLRPKQLSWTGVWEVPLVCHQALASLEGSQCDLVASRVKGPILVPRNGLASDPLSLMAWSRE